MVRTAARALVLTGLLVVAACGAKNDTATTEPPRSTPGTPSPTRDQTGGLGKSKKSSTPTTGATTGGAGTEGGADPPGTLSQWASGASATSSFGANPGDDFSAMKATGPADVDPNCRDDGNAWASKQKDTVDTLTLTYDTPLVPTGLRVFQTFNPGQVVKLELRGPGGKSKVIYQGEPAKDDGCPIEGFLNDLDVGFPVDTVAVTVDQSKLGTGFAEIDAVRLIGKPA